MKKLLSLFVALGLCACAGVTKDGETCFGSQSFKVLQGQLGGALAHECAWYEDLCGFNTVVYLTSPEGTDYYDNQHVTNDKGTCWVQAGVYRYTTTENIMKSVPKLKMVEK